TAAQAMPVMSIVDQMQATPARGEPDKRPLEARPTGCDDVYLPFCAHHTPTDASRCPTRVEHIHCVLTLSLQEHIPTESHTRRG
ncbi:oxidoreductase FeS-binding subunit, partial [Escherichia coli]